MVTESTSDTDYRTDQNEPPGPACIPLRSSVENVGSARKRAKPEIPPANKSYAWHKVTIS